MEPPPPVERPSGDEVRVPVRTVKPSATAFARSVWQFASGTVGDAFAGRLLGRSADRPTAPTIDAMTFAPLEVRETGAVVVLDRHGLRVEGSRELAFALAWSEVGRVSLQVQHSRLLGLRMLRLVFWPAHPHTFPAAHPECAPALVPELGGYALALTTSPRVPQADIDLALSGLALAGARFDGEVEEVSTGTG